MIFHRWCGLLIQNATYEVLQKVSKHRKMFGIWKDNSDLAAFMKCFAEVLRVAAWFDNLQDSMKDVWKRMDLRNNREILN